MDRHRTLRTEVSEGETSSVDGAELGRLAQRELAGVVCNLV